MIKKELKDMTTYELLKHLDKMEKMIKNNIDGETLEIKMEKGGYHEKYIENYQDTMQEIELIRDELRERLNVPSVFQTTDKIKSMQNQLENIIDTFLDGDTDE